jgi:acyl-[acyl-carrier-protein]-phospholipid O-acyltransferase/long-chain-fatty-acid--[acyl-carrier-protein] ligase
MLKLIKSQWTPLFASNFLGVFNDNLLKNSIIFISVSWLLPTWLSQSQLISIVSASLILPYLILSPLAGKIAVIYSKKQVFLFFKSIEIPIMIIASVAFYYEWVLLAIFSVLLMGIQSSLYSPSKYGLIRDIGGSQRAAFGSGVFEAMAFLGILLGTIVASYISDTYSPSIIITLFIGIAIFGYFTTRYIKAKELPEVKSKNSNLNPIKFLIESFRFANKHKSINLAIFGASSFWLIGGILQMNLVIHSKQIYEVSNTLTGLVMAFAAVGIGLGSWFVGKIANKYSFSKLIILGLVAMTTIMLTLTFIKINFYIYLLLILTFAFSGGFLQVPCLSLVQKADLGRELGTMIAYLNMVTFIFVLFGTFLFWSITLMTNENSFAVFGLISTICIVVLIVFLLKIKSTKL